MKIVHICLGCFYIENMGYQENILPKMHKQQGHEVTIITSRYTFDNKGTISSRDVGNYINRDGIKVHIIDYSWVNKYIMYATIHESYIDLLKSVKPDLIFVHGPQFWKIGDIIKYKKLFPATKIVIDSHGDYINGPINTIKKLILNKYLYRIPVRILAKYACKIWGVTPLRVKYLNDVYGLSMSTLDLLVMGGDDDKIHFDNASDIRKINREKVGIKDTDFLIITGGKIDKLKNIHLLMQAVSELNDIKLVVFGNASSEMAEKINELSKHDNIRYIRWIDSDEAYNWFLSSDLAVFPGTHSVLWEQAVACGTPCVFKHWDGMDHVDVGGNCKFLYNDSVNEIKNVLTEIKSNNETYNKMKQISIEKGIPTFSYKEIAKKSIDV